MTLTDMCKALKAQKTNMPSPGGQTGNSFIFILYV